MNRLMNVRTLSKLGKSVVSPKQSLQKKIIASLTLLLLSSSVIAANGDILGVNSALGLTPPQAQQSMPLKAAPQQPAAVSTASLPQAADYQANQESDVFGANLFTGAFARQGATQFNPDYVIASGDQIQLRIWGGLDYSDILTVDPKGNIFIPQVGPVLVMGVRNQELQRVVEAATRKVFRSNVYSYASLAAAQPVRIFIGGYVNRPGLYNGTSMDSLLYYLDQAGGIDPERGSFLDVQIKRGEQLRATVNLYDFLLDGRIPLVQLSEGDVIFVAPRKNTVKVSGLAVNSRRFEFSEASLTLPEMTQFAKPLAQATHVRVIRNSGTVRNVDYFALADANGITINNGDEVEFTADKKPGTITVRVEGEHLSPQEYVLPYGSRLGELLKQIHYSENSDKDNPQLFRLSVRERQKLMLQTSLKTLESTVLTARSGTSDEARLRTDEANLILQWVERAKNIEPRGQVLIALARDRDNLLLENGDILRIPVKDGLILVSGEVLFPNAIAYDNGYDVDDYIQFAGGYTQNADNSRIVVAHRDGSFTEDGDIRPGDEVLVLPKVDVKSRQIAKDLTQILYQLAISAKVVLGL